MANAWHTGPGSPAADLGEDTDHFLDLDTSRVFRKTDGTWRQIGILRAVGRGPTWLTGSGMPTATLGDNGDMYLDIATGNAYQKTTDTWIFLSELRGVAGTSGATPATVVPYNADSIEIPGTIGGPDTTLCEVAVPEFGQSIVIGKFVALYSKPESIDMQGGCSVTAMLMSGESTTLDMSTAMLTTGGKIVVPKIPLGTTTHTLAGAATATISLVGWGTFGLGDKVRMVAARTVGLNGDMLLATQCRLVVFRVVGSIADFSH